MFCLILSFFLLTGCSIDTATVKKISPPEEFSSEFVLGDFKGRITFRHMYKTEILFTSPPTVSGLRLITENGKTKMIYSAMVFETDGGKLTQASIGNMITAVISDLIVNNDTVEAVEENGFIKRNGKDYTLFQNKQSGEITEIIYKNYDIKFSEK